jgi:hypothetical protein
MQQLWPHRGTGSAPAAAPTRCQDGGKQQLTGRCPAGLVLRPRVRFGPTSRDLDLDHLAWWALRKGVTVVGTIV